jgi:hypothetical protein
MFWRTSPIRWPLSRRPAVFVLKLLVLVCVPLYIHPIRSVHIPIEPWPHQSLYWYCREERHNVSAWEVASTLSEQFDLHGAALQQFLTSLQWSYSWISVGFQARVSWWHMSFLCHLMHQERSFHLLFSLIISLLNRSPRFRCGEGRSSYLRYLPAMISNTSLNTSDV